MMARKTFPRSTSRTNPRVRPWAYGLGVYAPFGLSTNWPDSSPLRTFALKNKQTYRTYNFSVAWQSTPEFSFGGSFTYNKVDTDLNRAIGVFGPADHFRFAGGGHTFGANLGLLWKPSPRHSFGLSYHAPHERHAARHLVHHPAGRERTRLRRLSSFPKR